MSSAKRASRGAHFRQQIWHKQKFRCAWCEQPIPPSELQDASIDHWIPLHHRRCGGVDSAHNIRIMHRDCNHAKDNLCPVCQPDIFWQWKMLRESVSWSQDDSRDQAQAPSAAPSEREPEVGREQLGEQQDPATAG